MDMVEFDNIVDKEYIKKTVLSNKEVDNIISDLQMYSNDIEMLTKQYTDILIDDNVMYILTRISQKSVFKNHFPEFYEKNKYGESVINCQQNTPYHRFGVFKHVLCAIENAGKESLKFNANEIKILKWTMLLHDIGKPMAKMVNGIGTDSFAGHDDISVQMAKEILDRFYFTEEEKNVILTLIKYHDKYLNEGDLTYDNLSFLAKELGDRKDLFYLLIEVKIADNKAKSIDVYNKFLNTQNKYYEFAKEYFDNEEDNRIYGMQFENEMNVLEDGEQQEIVKKEVAIYEEGGNDKDIDEKKIVSICKEITIGENIKFYYQPVIDLKNKVVEGYEVYYKIITKEDYSYKQIMRKAKEFEKYDKMQQMLLLNALNNFNDLQASQELFQYVNIDVRSYKNYVNKARIFDAVKNRKVVIVFNNFELINNNILLDLVEDIHKAKAFVAINNFESSNKEFKDIDKIDPKVVKYKLEKIDENSKKYLQQLLSYCTARMIKLIVFGINTKEQLDVAMDAGVRYVQGNYFSKPRETIDMTKSEVEECINQIQDELIV